MSDIAKRLRASVAFNAIDGDSFERSICGKQMFEAAVEIESLRRRISELEQPAEQEQEQEQERTRRWESLQDGICPVTECGVVEVLKTGTQCFHCGGKIVERDQ